jgi:hypothetical protein
MLRRLARIVGSRSLKEVRDIVENARLGLSVFAFGRRRKKLSAYFHRHDLQNQRKASRTRRVWSTLFFIV